MTTNAKATLQHTIFHKLVDVHHTLGIPADNVQQLAVEIMEAVLAPHVRWATAQAAQEEMKDDGIAAECARALVEDLADHGVRFDLTPTMAYSYPADIDRHTENVVSSEISQQYCDYIERIDESIRERAAVALGRVQRKPQTLVAQCNPDTEGE
jgi:hypothetical protein